MTMSWRVLPALVLAVAAFAPVAPASADGDYCTYFRWDREQRRWEMVAVLQHEPREHEFDWDCKYCYLQAPSHPVIDDVLDIVNETIPPLFEAVQGRTAEVVGPAELSVTVGDEGSPSAVQVVVGGASESAEDAPACPEYAPVWFVVGADLITDFVSWPGRPRTAP